MLASSARVSPCRALWWSRSVGRRTTTIPSASATARSGCTSRVRRPLGPFTSTVRPVTSTSTPFGIGMGAFPTRDMTSPPAPLPDVTQDLAPDAHPPGLPVGHDAARGGENDHTHALADAPDRAPLGVQAQPRAARPAQPREDLFLARPV